MVEKRRAGPTEIRQSDVAPKVVSARSPRRVEHGERFTPGAIRSRSMAGASGGESEIVRIWMGEWGGHSCLPLPTADRNVHPTSGVGQAFLPVEGHGRQECPPHVGCGPKAKADRNVRPTKLRLYPARMRVISPSPKRRSGEPERSPACLAATEK